MADETNTNDPMSYKNTSRIDAHSRDQTGFSNAPDAPTANRNYGATPLYYLDERFSSYVNSYDIKTSFLFALSYLA